MLTDKDGFQSCVRTNPVTQKSLYPILGAEFSKTQGFIWPYLEDIWTEPRNVSKSK